MVQRYPYAQNTFGPAEADLLTYTSWATGIVAKLGRALEEIHARGIRFGDLHPSNIIVRPDGDIALVDFEYCRDLDDTTIIDGGAPGFVVPSGVVGASADHYQLECVRIWLFLPMNLRPEHTPAQLRRAINTVIDLFPVERTFRASVSSGLALSVSNQEVDVADELLATDIQDWSAIRDSVVAGIMESASCGRGVGGALFPGSPSQFGTGGFNVAYGAAGVLLALHRVNAEVPSKFVDWMVAEALSCRDALPGLLDGLHGVALVLDELGYVDQAHAVLARARVAESKVATAGLMGGKAGFGLNLLYFARRTQDSKYLTGAMSLGEQLARLTRSGEETEVLRSPTSAGLLRGMSGIALLFLHLFDVTNDQNYLDHARAALQQDIDHGEMLGGDTFHLIEHSMRRRNIIYVDGGSAGLAIVAHEYQKYRPDGELYAAEVGVRRGCRAPFVRDPGLFRGRAGLMATLAHLNQPDDRDVMRKHVSRLAVHAQPFRGHLAFPGTKLLRLSMDVASGSAGILLALNAAFGGAGTFLPYLDPRMPNLPREQGGR